MRQYLQAERIHDGHKFWPAASILIIEEDGTIVGIKTKEEIESHWSIQEIPGILCPGFVNAHTHLELSHLKGKIERGTGLLNFVRGVQKFRYIDVEVIKMAIEKAGQEMMDSGVVAVGDICNSENAFSFHKDSELHVQAFIEALGFNRLDAEARMEYVVKLNDQHIQEVQKGQENFIKSSIVPHAPYSISDALFERINVAAKDKVLTIHSQEITAENEFFQTKTGEMLQFHQDLGIDNTWFEAKGKNSLPIILPQINQAKKILFVHNTFTEESDIIFAKKSSSSQIYWTICIRANQYIENALPPIPLLRAHQQKICLGTDSLASNDSLSIWDEIMTIQEHFPDIPLEETLSWATYNGAEALDMQGEIGSFEKGKKPGIVWVHAGRAKRLQK